jgi:hypothetical protein
VIDLSKCTELVNGWPIVYGPERKNVASTYPWQAVVDRPLREGGLCVLSFTDEGKLWQVEGSVKDLKLPEQEFIYLERSPDGGLTPTLSIYAATHRYRDDDPTTMEAVKDE